jgi:hypothetical protein
MPRTTKRKAKPDPEPYMRLLLGIPAHLKFLEKKYRDRLDLAVAFVNFIGEREPDKTAMKVFIEDQAADLGRSESWCYDQLTKLKETTLIKFDTYWQQYRLNPERFKRDMTGIRSFEAQFKLWQKNINPECP